MAKIVRLGVILGLVFSFSGKARAEDEISVFPGLITANNVDVTADDGSLLPDRLNVGDSIFIIQNPKKEKKGWVRISRSPSDTTGIGWVETKNCRTFSRYGGVKEESKPSASEMSGEKTVFAPDVEKAKYSKIGIVPFVAAEPDDPVAQFAYEAFTTSMKKKGQYQVSEVRLSAPGADVEDPSQLKGVSKNVDGVFIGKLSGDLGGSRLLQVKFYGRDRDGFVLEKVTRLPKEGNLQDVIDKLVASTVQMLK